MADGEALVVGNVTITAHRTPGHTPGGTSWSWRSCDGDQCLDLVYADSLNAVSAPGYRFTDHPDVVAALRASAATIGGLPCDVLVTVHPDFTDLFGRLDRHALVDPGACAAYAADAASRLDRKLADEAKTPASGPATH